MSRVGKEKIYLYSNENISKKVNYNVKDNKIILEGPLGKTELNIPVYFNIVEENNYITVNIDETKKHLLQKNENINALHGTTVRLIKNAVNGVSNGFEVTFLFKGLGFRYALENNEKRLNIQLGYSHLILLDIPEGIKAVFVKQDQLLLKSISKDLLGHFGEKLKKLRKWNPYSGKGIITDKDVPKTKKVVKSKK